MGNSFIYYSAGTLPNKFNYGRKTLTASCFLQFMALTAICIEIQLIQFRQNCISRYLILN